MDPRLWAIIRTYAPRYGLDPRAVAAVAMNESGGRFGAVGDGGTSFGPWQLHVGGALPAGRNAAWANSLPGILYALQDMASSGARGLRGYAAVNAIARGFERPADPGAEVNVAMGYYNQPGFAAGSPVYRGGPIPAGGGGVAPRGGGAPMMATNRGNPGAALAALSLIRPLSVSVGPLNLPTAKGTLQNLFAPPLPAATTTPAPLPGPSLPGVASAADQASSLDAIHSKLLAG